jgi:hypothetical protein
VKKKQEPPIVCDRECILCDADVRVIAVRNDLDVAALVGSAPSPLSVYHAPSKALQLVLGQMNVEESLPPLLV